MGKEKLNLSYISRTRGWFGQMNVPINKKSMF